MDNQQNMMSKVSLVTISLVESTCNENSEVCGLSKIMDPLFLERDNAAEICKI